ncbi:MAG: hypothetical protein HY964_05460 [Ignavibacteriales bacterium]|nr:hypothetical protein [Ignavibacteriales bacterium]
MKDRLKVVLDTNVLLVSISSKSKYHRIYDKLVADDNKFADCTINSNSHLLVTNDKHFQVLKNIDFPKIEVTSINDFAAQLGINISLSSR